MEHLIPQAEKDYMLFGIKGAEYYAYYLDGKLVGFAGLKVYPSYLKILNDYVVPEHRGKGIYRKLFSIRWNDIISMPQRRIKTIATAMSERMFLSYGFKVTRVHSKTKEMIYDKDW